ncbi:MAG: peptide deformylase [Candidatus Sumerlaeia bacterium]|nr:peptide deformylase [Candidatus Sumerlaeia bacterium]
MAILPIKLYGDPVLRERALPVSVIDDDLRRLAADMGETMYAAAGIGLAANQIGELRRILVIDVDQMTTGADGKRGPRDPQARRLQVFLNAEITAASDDDGDYDEGCLSIPDVESTVYRPNSVRVRYRTLEGEDREGWFSGMTARVLQHEIDHLDGVLFVDRIAAEARSALAGKLARIRRGEVPSAVDELLKQGT